MVAVPTGRLSETVGASDRMSRVPAAASRKSMISWATVMWNAACELGGDSSSRDDEAALAAAGGKCENH